MTLHSVESQEISIGNKIIFRVKNAVYSTLISYAGLRTSLSSGVTIRLDTYADWIIYNEIFVDGEYRKAIDLAFSKLQLGRKPVFVDLGANVGFFTLFL